MKLTSFSNFILTWDQNLKSSPLKNSDGINLEKRKKQNKKREKEETKNKIKSKKDGIKSNKK